MISQCPSSKYVTKGDELFEYKHTAHSNRYHESFRQEFRPERLNEQYSPLLRDNPRSRIEKSGESPQRQRQQKEVLPFQTRRLRIRAIGFNKVELRYAVPLFW